MVVMTIGPHEGTELKRMLAGDKPLAAFGDIIPNDGSIPEEIIPERQFAPYVENGTILRFENVINLPNKKLMYVCFTLSNEEWRAKTYMWLREQISLKALKYDDAHDWVFGRLLGYSDKDIQHFLDNQKKRRAYIKTSQ